MVSNKLHAIGVLKHYPLYQICPRFWHDRINEAWLCMGCLTRDPQHAPCSTVESSHTSKHTQTQVNPHVSWSSQTAYNQMLSCVSLMLIFALSSFIENLCGQRGMSWNYFWRWQTLYSESFNFVAFHQGLTGVTQKAKAYTVTLYILCEIQFRFNILVLMSNFLHHDHVLWKFHFCLRMKTFKTSIIYR